MDCKTLPDWSTEAVKWRRRSEANNSTTTITGLRRIFGTILRVQPCHRTGGRDAEATSQAVSQSRMPQIPGMSGVVHLANSTRRTQSALVLCLPEARTVDSAYVSCMG